MFGAHKGGAGWNGYLGNDAGPANISLTYFAGFDPDAAATVFDDLLACGAEGVRSAEAGPTYWRIHAIRQMGLQHFDACTDVATSQVSSLAGVTSWVGFNAGETPRVARCYEAGKQVATVTAAPLRLNTMRNGTVTMEENNALTQIDLINLRKSFL